MTEGEGRAVLKGVFEGAGYRISEDVPLSVAGSQVTIDGFDVEAQVGYELLTTEAGDRREFTPLVVRELEGRIERGELRLLLIDERDATAALLTFAAERFLERVRSR
jgi:hypothetical protein